jgi:hypothetical protein
MEFFGFLPMEKKNGDKSNGINLVTEQKAELHKTETQIHIYIQKI